MQIKANEIKMVATSALVPHEKNRNKHSDEQIDRLAKIIKYSGFRQPIVVSNLSQRIISGHGRVLAAKKLGMSEVPVVYEDFNNEDEEYQHLTADNSIAAWAELDLSGINADIGDLGPDFDLDLLGIKDFVLDLGAEHALDDKEKPEDQGGTHILEVHLTSEKEMVEVYEDLLSRGLIVKYK